METGYRYFPHPSQRNQRVALYTRGKFPSRHETILCFLIPSNFIRFPVPDSNPGEFLVGIVIRKVMKSMTARQWSCYIPLIETATFHQACISSESKKPHFGSSSSNTQFPEMTWRSFQRNNYLVNQNRASEEQIAPPYDSFCASRSLTIYQNKYNSH